MKIFFFAGHRPLFFIFCMFLLVTYSCSKENLEIEKEAINAEDEILFRGEGPPPPPPSFGCPYPTRVFSTRHKGSFNYEGPIRNWSNGNIFLGPQLALTSNEWEITAIASGDLDNTGTDNMITAYHDFNGFVNETRIWMTGDDNMAETMIWNGENGWTISAMTTGDFDNDGVDELAVAFNYGGGDNPTEARIWIYERLSDSWSLLYSTDEWAITALAGGNVWGNSTDDLVVGFKNTFSDEPRIWIYDFGASNWNLYWTGGGEWVVGHMACGNWEGDEDSQQEIAVGFNNEGGGKDRIWLTGADLLPTPWQLVKEFEKEEFITGLAAENVNCVGNPHDLFYAFAKEVPTTGGSNYTSFIISTQDPVGAPNGAIDYSSSGTPYYVRGLAAANHD